MRLRTKANLQLFVGITLVSTLVGPLYMLIIVDKFDSAWIVPFAAQGALLGAFFALFEIYFVQKRGGEFLRKAPFIIAHIAKTLMTIIILAAAFMVGGLFLFPERFTPGMMGELLLRDVGFAFIMVAIIQAVLMVRRIVGGRVLANMVGGRYHRPLKEDRIFLFLDLEGSTLLSEKLGDLGVHALISKFFFDVAQITFEFGGETHRYIGDEVVVTWPLARGIARARCVRCCLAIQARIEEQKESYHQEFGVVPKFRIGLHGGPVVAGECGDDKREIVYFGNTINATARIESACKKVKRRFLISSELLSHITLPADIKAENMGLVDLKGRKAPMELFAITFK